MIHSHATIFLVSLASHMRSQRGILRRTAEKLTEKDILVSLMMRFSIQNVNYLVAHIHGINFMSKRWQTFAFGLQSDKIPAFATLGLLVMSVNTAESENAQPVAHKTSQRINLPPRRSPALPQTLFAAFQHLLAMFVAVITPAAVNLPGSRSPGARYQHIISCRCSPPASPLLFRSKLGPGRLRTALHPGHQLQLCRPADHGRYRLENGGADVPHDGRLFGTLMLASCTEMVLSRILHLARRIITPLVSGVVVMIIGCR
ncbi:putative purine/xanthine transport protein [Klebsiella pneumoniae]|nr:putative purine/xanthine transport protein [Klebsiella pneumoniae]